MIQEGLQQDLHSIVIKGLSLGTTDFDRVSKETIHQMFEAGRQSAKSFLDNETEKLRTSLNKRIEITSESLLYDELVRPAVREGDEVLILANSNRLLYSMFPTVLDWAYRKAKISFITVGSGQRWPAGGDQERLRDIILGVMGAARFEVDHLPFQAALFRHGDGLSNVVLMDNQEGGIGSYGATYTSVVDRSVVNLLWKTAISTRESAALVVQGADVAPVFEKRCENDILSRLKRVRQYSGKGVRLCFAEIPVEKITFLTRSVSPTSILK